MGGACFKPVFLPPSTTHTPRWAGSWFSGMPGLLSQHRESWLSVFWEMSGLQETKDSHSHHPAGGWGAERAGCMGNGGPSVQRAGCEGVFTWAGGVGTRIWLFEAEGELAKWRGSMCKGNVCWGHMCSYSNNYNKKKYNENLKVKVLVAQSRLTLWDPHGL